MVDFISLYEAKTRLSNLVDRAAAGEEFVITKNGIPFAKLVPAPSTRRARRPAHALASRGDAVTPIPGIERLFYEGEIEPPETGSDRSERKTGNKRR